MKTALDTHTDTNTYLAHVRQMKIYDISSAHSFMQTFKTQL